MTFRFTVNFVSIVLLLVCLPLSISAASSTSEVTTPAAVRAVLQSVVRIHVVASEYYGGREIKQESFGSGAIITKDGYLVTNHHVAGKGKFFTCTLSNREEVLADLIATDPLVDIAVMKLHPRPGGYLPAVFGDSKKLKIGQRVYSIGSPLAIDQSITSGIVSNLAFSLPEFYPDEMFVLDGEDVGSIVQWIGHDAQIFPGNSGGPLLNSQGEIIGINEISMGLSGAIPGNIAHDIARQLIHYRTVKRGWLGFSVQPLLKSSKLKHGVLIDSTIEGSPARKAGFQSGDVLLSLGDKKIDVRYREDLPPFNLMVMSLPVGKPVKASVLRGGKTIALSIVPAQRPPAKTRPQELSSWGICANDIGSFEASKLQRKSKVGVRVDSMRPGGAADNAKPSLRVSDIIVEVNGEQVKNVSALRDLTQRLMKDKSEPFSVLVVIERNQERYRTVVKLGVENTQDSGREARKAWLPVGMQVLTGELAEKLNMPGKSGVCITQVYPGFSSVQDGLKVGDIIIALDGDAIPASRPEELDVLPEMVRQYPIGSKVELTIVRDGTESKVTLELPAAPSSPGEMKRYRNDEFEFNARNLAFRDCIDNGWKESQQGAIVESVTPGGWASLGHLETGDLIKSIDGKPITNVETLSTVMKGIIDKKPEYAVVVVSRGSRDLYLEWRAKWVKKQ